MVSSSSSRTKVFISYSHNDARYLRQLVEHLVYYERNNLIEFWSDEKISAGAQWRDEIKRAIEATKVAVLLLSPSFLASEFIAENELPPLLLAAKEEGAIILPIIVRSSNFEDTEIAKFQAVNSPSKPVAGMKPYQRDEFWAKVVRDIKNAVVPQPEIYEVAKAMMRKAAPDKGEEKLDEDTPQPIQKNSTEEGDRQLNKEPPQAHEVNSGLHMWLLGRVLIIALTILWVLGANFTGISFLASIILPIITGFGLLVMFETWYATKHPSKADDDNDLTKTAKILQTRYLWKNPKLRIGSIILLVILIAGIMFYTLQPHPGHRPLQNDAPCVNDSPSYLHLPCHVVLAFNDPLSDKSTSLSNATDSCAYFTGVYSVNASKPNFFTTCLLPTPSFSNFAFEVKMFIIRGDCGGVTFRGDISNKLGYYFYVCQNGYFDLNIDDPPTKMLKSNSNPVIIQGLHQTNLIAVVANGNSITLYVNQQPIAHVTDSTYSHGQFGLTANTTTSSTPDTEYSKAKIWIWTL